MNGHCSSSNQACMNINDVLPNEILGYIFTFTSVRDRLLFISSICRKWRQSVIYTDLKSCEVFDLHDDLCASDFECVLRKKKWWVLNLKKFHLEASFSKNFSQQEESAALNEWLEKFSAKLLSKIGASLKVLSFQMKRHQSVVLRTSIGFRIELMSTVLKYVNTVLYNNIKLNWVFVCFESKCIK